MESEEVRRIAYDGYGIYDNFAHQVWSAYEGFTPEGGYVKYMDNKDAAQLFEDLYQVKEDLKALVESKVFRRQKRLDMATLEDENFQEMFAWAQEDLDIHSCKQLKMRLMKIAKKIKKNLKNCPIA